MIFLPYFAPPQEQRAELFIHHIQFRYTLLASKKDALIFIAIRLRSQWKQRQQYWYPEHILLLIIA